MNEQYYIGCRLTVSETAKLFGDSLLRLNQNMAETLRSVALKQNIKKTQKGKRLEFYCVSKEQLDMLTKESTKTWLALKEDMDWHPLIVVDAAKMKKAVDKVNGNYSNSMDKATFCKYKMDLTKAVEISLHKIAEDKKISKEKYTNPGLAVGDIIPYQDGWRRTSVAVVTKITDAGYQVQPYMLAFDYRLLYQKSWVKNHGGQYNGDHYTGNSSLPITNELFVLGKKKSYRWTQYTEGKVFTKNSTSVYQTYWDID